MPDIKYQNLIFKENGEFICSDVPGSTFPADMMILLSSLLKQKFNQESTSLLFEIGKSAGKDLNKYLDKNLTRAIDQLSLLGVGQFMLVRNTKINSIIENRNNGLAESSKKLNGLGKDTTDFLLAGILAGLFEARFGLLTYCKETQCIVQGKQSCVFEITTKA